MKTITITKEKFPDTEEEFFGKKAIVVESHAYAYTLTEFKGEEYLIGFGMYKDGTFNCAGDIEESPKEYRETHLEIAKKLGAKDPEKVVSGINYY